MCRWNLSNMSRTPGRPRKNWRGHYPRRWEGRWIDMGLSKRIVTFQKQLGSTCGPMCLWHGMNFVLWTLFSLTQSVTCLLQPWWKAACVSRRWSGLHADAVGLETREDRPTIKGVLAGHFPHYVFYGVDRSADDVWCRTYQVRYFTFISKHISRARVYRFVKLI